MSERGYGFWKDRQGQALDCYDKIELLEKSIDEIKELMDDALEEAIIMGCDERQFLGILHKLVDDLKASY